MDHKVLPGAWRRQVNLRYRHGYGVLDLMQGGCCTASPGCKGDGADLQWHSPLSTAKDPSKDPSESSFLSVATGLG